MLFAQKFMDISTDVLCAMQFLQKEFPIRFSIIHENYYITIASLDGFRLVLYWMIVDLIMNLLKFKSQHTVHSIYIITKYEQTNHLNTILPNHYWINMNFFSKLSVKHWYNVQNGTSLQILWSVTSRSSLTNEKYVLIMYCICFDHACIARRNSLNLVEYWY